MKKKMISLLLCLGMTLTALAGCGAKETDTVSSETETTNEAESTTEAEQTEATDATDAEEGIPLDAFAGTTLKIAVARNGSDMSESYSEKPAFQMAEEATGIKIEWLELESGAAQEQLSTIIASQDMPDVFLNLVNEKTIASEMDAFYDLSEEGLLETYAPNVLADYESIDGGGLATLTWSDGSIRSLMGGFEVQRDSEATALVWINKAWLDQLDMEIPTTAEEFYNVLKAFKENDMNGNGDTTDEIPLTFANKYWAGDFTNLAGSFGIANTGVNYLMVKDGKVVPTLNTDEYRAFLEYYHRLAEEGLLDVEGFSQSTEQHKTKIAEGTVGVFMGWTPRTFLTELDVATQYVSLKPFQGIEGVEPVMSGRKNNLAANRNMFVVSADTENVEAALHWWNYLSSSTEIKYTLRYGKQGQSWDFNENGQPVDTTATDLAEGMVELSYDYTYGLGSNTTFIRKDESFQYDMSDPTNATAWRIAAVDEVWDMMVDEYLPIKFTDPEKIEERTFIEVDLINYIKNFIATSVVEGITDESWEQHLEDLETWKYSEWIDWYQRFYDGEY